MAKHTNMRNLIRWGICIGVLLTVLFWRTARPEQVRMLHQAVFGTEEIVEVFGVSDAH